MIKPLLRSVVPAMERLVSTRLIQITMGNFVPIFMLHRFDHPDYGISGMSPSDIAKCLAFFRKRGYQALSLPELALLIESGAPVPYKLAVFTIDDGFIDQYDIAGPLFASFDIPLTYFLITDFIDGDLWPWDDQLAYLFKCASEGRYQIKLVDGSCDVILSDGRSRQDALHEVRESFKRHDNTNIYSMIEQAFRQCRVESPASAPREYTPMSWSQAQSLEAAGHEVAGHTRTHRILSRLDDAEAKSEIEQSIGLVNNRLGKTSTVFAYPTGRSTDFTEREYNILEQSGIKATVTTVHKSFQVRGDFSIERRHNLPRYSMPASLEDFIQYLSWIEYVKNKVRS